MHNVKLKRLACVLTGSRGAIRIRTLKNPEERTADTVHQGRLADNPALFRPGIRPKAASASCARMPLQKPGMRVAPRFRTPKTQNEAEAKGSPGQRKRARRRHRGKASRGTEAASAKPPAAEAAHAEARPCGKISNRRRRARKKSSRPASKTASRHMLQKAQPRLRITRRAPKTMRLHHRPSARPEHLSPRAMPMVKRHFMQPLILAPIIAAFWWPRPHAPASFVSWMPFRASYGLAKA